MKKAASRVMMFVLTFTLLLTIQAPAQTSVGLGGGGSTYGPVISPSDPNTIFVSCDLTGLYRSTDGGQHWTLLDGRFVQGSTNFTVAFDPTNTNHLVGFHPQKGLMESFQGGIDGSWSPFAAQIPKSNPNINVVLTAFAFSADATPKLLAGTTNGLFSFVPANGAQPAQWVAQTLPTGASANILKILFLKDPGTSQQVPFTASSTGIYNETSTTWNAVSSLPITVSDFAGGSNAVHYALYAVGNTSVAYRFASDSQSWTPFNPDTTLTGSCAEFQRVGVSNSNPDTAYVTTTFPDRVACPTAVYKGAFSGGLITWSHVYNGFQGSAGVNLTPGWIEINKLPNPPNSPIPAYGLDWTFGGAPHGFAVAPSDPSTVVFTNNAATHVTRDGGTSWTQRYTSGTAPGGPWQTTGMDITTAWNYYIRNSTHLIANTDIALSRSTDSGKTWNLISRSDITPSSAGAEWNTFYELASDGNIGAGSSIWAAVSGEHDIPYESELDDSVVLSQRGATIIGAVLLSTDEGATWHKLSDASLPNAPVVALINNGGVLYASVWGHGVYKSTAPNLGTTWTPVGATSVGLHPYRLHFDPSGNLYVSVAASVTHMPLSVQSGGLFELVGTTWVDVTSSLKSAQSFSGESLSPMDFTFDPADSSMIYLAAETIAGSAAPSGAAPGGLYKFNPSATPQWTKLTTLDTALAAANYHDSIVAYAPSFISNTLYVTTITHGTWQSADKGATWSEAFTSVPFLGSQRLVPASASYSETVGDTFDSAHFTTPSFTLTAPASFLTTAAVTVNGSEQSSTTTGSPGAPGTGGTITISGTDRKIVNSDGTNFDTGDVIVTVGPTSKDILYSKTSTNVNLASAVAAAFNNDPGSVVSATLSGASVSFTSRTVGTSTNYAVSTSAASNFGFPFTGTSFTVSPASTALTGGQNAVAGTSVFDAGTVTLTVNGHVETVSYGQSSASATLAAALANQINSDTAAQLTATASGSTVNLAGVMYITTLGGSVRKTGAPAVCAPLTGTVTISGTEQSTTTGGSPGAPGTGGTITISGTDRKIVNSDGTNFDTGDVIVTVGPTSKDILYSKTSTNVNLASAVAAAFTNDPSSVVTATASGSSVSFTSRTVGASTNYAVSTSAASNFGFPFTGTSFTVSPASTALTGGQNAVAGGTTFDAGTVTITVNGTPYTISYGQGSTSASVASALVSQINGDSAAVVMASLSGSTVTLTTKLQCSVPHYTLSATTTHQFPAPSFNATASGPTLQ
jgi:phage tail sheath gpL-like